MSVTPEQFGAVGDRTTDDTLAFQRAADSGATRIVGVPGSVYFLDGQRAQWSEQDLHRIGAIPQGATLFPEGYWYGVRVPSGVDIEDMAIVTRKGVSDLRASHALAFGDPTSLTRSHNRVRRCAFTVHDFQGAVPKFPRIFLAQSVDYFIFDGNTINGFDADNPQIAGYLFDCQHPDLTDNIGLDVALSFAVQFATGVEVSGMDLSESGAMLDLDKAIGTAVVAGNTYTRTVAPTNPNVDAVIEVNGCEALTCTGNAITNCRRGIIYGAKTVANSWLDALNGTATPVFTPCRNIVSANTITGATFIVVSVGAQWANYPHPGVSGCENVQVSDVIDGGTTGLLVNECDGLLFDGSITNVSSHGIHLRTSLEADSPGAGEFSVTRATLSGTVENCGGRGLYAEHVNEIVFDGIVFRNCVAPVVDVRNASTKGMAISGNFSIEHDTADDTITTLASLSLADGSYTPTLTLTAGANSWIGPVSVVVTAGTAVVTPSLVATNPDGLGGPTVDGAGSALRIRATGKPATPVSWTMELTF